MLSKKVAIVALLVSIDPESDADKKHDEQSSKY